MTYALGLGITFILISAIIYVLPIFSEKVTFIFILLVTTLSFVLSSLMANLYSPSIGIVIFLLLISSLSLLVGKKRSWIEGITRNKQTSSRRKRYRDILIEDRTNLENIYSSEDHLLYQRTLNGHEPVSQNSELIELDQNIHSSNENNAYLEVAASTEDTIYPKEQMTVLDVNEDLIDDKTELKDQTIKVIEDVNATLVNEEFSDQWMEKRLQSLFENEQKNVHLSKENTSDHVKTSHATRYDDLSEGYFNQVRRENDGTKE